MVHPGAHRQLLNRMLAYYGIQSDSLEIVPDVQAWAHEHHVEETNPFRIAKCLCQWSDNSCHIAIVSEITDDMISSAKTGMELRGFAKDLVLLETDLKFLAHTMLHEIACFVLRTTEQKPRDAWAFKELANHAV